MSIKSLPSSDMETELLEDELEFVLFKSQRLIRSMEKLRHLALIQVMETSNKITLSEVK